MTSREAVTDFLAQRTLALAGMSRGGRGFGNVVHRELKAKGYTVYAVHPQADLIGGERCWPSLADLPGPVGGVVVSLPPGQAENVVREAHRAGIRRVWLSQGSESPEAIRFCEEHGMAVIARECILMFAEPAAWIHRVHRGLWRMLGKLPA